MSFITELVPINWFQKIVDETVNLLKFRKVIKAFASIRSLDHKMIDV
jgi:hypothetical protein